MYIEDALLTNVSVLAFLSVAFSTNSNILFTVEFSYFSVTFTSINPSSNMLPDRICPFSSTCTSLLSPVNDAVFIFALPFMIVPSNGTFSPCFTIIISPIFTSSGFIVFISFPCFIFAYSGFMFIKSDIDFLLLFIAFSSSIFPNSYNIITIKPSMCFPTKYAPIHDIVISMFSFIFLLLNNIFTAFFAVLNSNIPYPIITNIVFNTTGNSSVIPAMAIPAPTINLINCHTVFVFCSSLFTLTSVLIISTSGSCDFTIFSTSSTLTSSVSYVNFNLPKFTFTLCNFGFFDNFCCISFAHPAQSKFFN